MERRGTHLKFFVELAPAFHAGYSHLVYMRILENISLAEFTTLRLGGPARFFVSVTTVEELREAVAYAHTNALPILILGGGSNVLCVDEGWDGLVIRIAITGRDYTENTCGDAQVIAFAGEVWDDLVRDSVEQGFWGLENMSYIPGTVGATPVQNVGCYGVSVSDCIDWVEVYDMSTDRLHIFTGEDCAFGYRDSVFKRSRCSQYVVTRVAYRLFTSACPNIEYADLKEYFTDTAAAEITPAAVRAALKEIRGRKFPDLNEVGTAGSFFKNPVVSRTTLHDIETWIGEQVPAYPIDDEHVKIPLGWLLERFGWKGKCHGAVGCWPAQSLVLVQYGGATAREFILFAHEIMQDVKRRTSLKIEPEVHIARSAQSDVE